MNHGKVLVKYIASMWVYLFVMVFSAYGPPAAAETVDPDRISPRMHSIIETHTLRIKSWAASPLLIEAVREQNEKRMPLEEIQRIDSDWIAGRADDLATALVHNGVGRYLRGRIDKNKQLYTEAFLCDNQGAVVGEFPKTSDYWQGDEDKFIMCYNNGKGRDYAGPLEFDESTGIYSVQVSVPVLDEGKTIGVLVVGLNNI